MCAAFFMAIVSGSYLAFGVSALLMEVNSVFLHGRRLLLFSGFCKDSLSYRVNSLFLIVTFFAFRFIALALIANFQIRNRHLLPTSHFVLSCTAGITIIFLNVDLFILLWKADFRQQRQKTATK